MSDSFEISVILPASPERVYHAWLSSEEHSAFTGDPAEITPEVGGPFSASGHYIEGVTEELEPNHRIVQSWRTTEFPPGSPDSRLELILDKVEGGTRLTLRHTNIPKGQGQMYKDGWIEWYFEPMQAYFSKD